MRVSTHYRNAFVLLILAVGFGIAGCQRSSSTQSPAADVTADSASPAEAILEQSRRLSEAYVQGDIDALVSVYTADGVAAPSRSDFVQGRPALDSLWALPPGRTILRHVATPVELVIEGDYAYDWGYYEGEVAQDGESLGTFEGKYVIVWRRGEDGTWRIAVDMWNSLPDRTSD